MFSRMAVTTTPNTAMAMNGPAMAASVGEVEMLSTMAPKDMAVPAAIQGTLLTKYLLRCSRASFWRNLLARLTTLVPFALSMRKPPERPATAS